ncbi:hypothetical protein KIW84_030004 [Lathyrus oleraceus]|uniref:Uncharacterized protein n=1 Tax=Pisum sativum TaxID=3888 RepID=A0A9D4XNG2_PEA|nr:hypothetical protein KIW84_030004 [Pisum sativum]
MTELGGLLGPELSDGSFVYLGLDAEQNVVYCTIDLSGENGFAPEFGGVQFNFVELSTFMVTADWLDSIAMENLSIVGHLD